MNLPLIAYAVIVTIAWFWTIAILIGKLNEITTLRGILVDLQRQRDGAKAKVDNLSGQVSAFDHDGDGRIGGSKPKGT